MKFISALEKYGSDRSAVEKASWEGKCEIVVGQWAARGVYRLDSTQVSCAPQPVLCALRDAVWPFPSCCYDSSQGLK